MKAHRPSESEVLQELRELEYMSADYRTAPACRYRMEILRNLLAVLRREDPAYWSDSKKPELH